MDRIQTRLLGWAHVDQLVRRRASALGRQGLALRFLPSLGALALLLAGSVGTAGATSGTGPDGGAAVIPLAADAVSAASSAQGADGPELLVKFGSVSPEAQTRVLTAVAATKVGAVRDLGVDVVAVPSGHAGAALNALRQNPAVAYAEPNAILVPQEQLPNDPYFLNSGSWNLGGGAWGWYVTHTPQAWDVTQGDPSVVIAILDTGIKTSGLSDFANQIASTWNVLNNTSDATSNAGNHGTYVAGVAALAAGNGVGNAGYCPICRLMIVQVGTDSGASLSDLANGLTYAADHGARVANMSWAGSSNSSTLQNAINYAHNKGLVVTAAAGNSNCNCVSYPAADQNVLGVAGVSDAAGDKQGDSNYGSWVKVAAPEGNLTAWPTINGAAGYAAVGGTSVAAPAVAGIAGLLFSYDPSLTNAQVEQALEASAAPVNFSIAFGRVDALAALRYLGAADPQPASAPVQTAPPAIYYELNGWTSLAPLGTSPQVGQVLVRGIGGWTGSAGLSVSGLQWQRCSSSGCTYLGNQSTYTVQSVDAGYSIKLSFSVGNSYGSVPVTVLTQPVVGSGSTTTTTNTTTTTTTSTATPPLNTTPPTISGTPQAGQTLTATTGSWSGSPSSFGFQWQDCDSNGSSCTSIGAANAASYAAQAADVGHTLRVVVTASDSGGSTAATSAATAVVASPPSTTSSGSALQTQTFSGSLNPQNGSRSFAVSVGAGVANAKLSFSKCSTLSLGLSTGAAASGPSVVALDATLAAGTYTYTVTGSKCSFTLTVTAPSP